MIRYSITTEVTILPNRQFYWFLVGGGFLLIVDIGEAHHKSPDNK